MSAQEKIHLHDPFQSANIVVHFIGDTLLDGTREIDYHWNPGWEICLTPYGRGIFRIDDTPYAVSGGHVFHTCASERHGGWPSAEDPVRILYVCLSPGPSPSPEWQAVFQGMEALAAPLARDVDDLTGLHLRLLRLARTGGRTGVQDDDAKDGLGNQRMDGWGDGWRERSDTNERPQGNGKRCGALRDGRLFELVFEQTLFVFLLSFLRCHASMTQADPHRKEDVVRAVLRLLADPAWTVTQVAAALGFTSIHHFSRAFRQVYGLPPNEMRGIQPRDVGML